MIQETIGTDKCEGLINQLLTEFLDSESVLNERIPGARPKDQPYTGFMVFWAEGNAHVYKPTFYSSEDNSMKQAIADDVYVTARIICYGKSSMKRVMAIRSLLNSDIAVIQQIKQHLGVCDIDDAQAIPEPEVNGTVRERTYFNFKFYARVIHQFDIDFFDRVTVTTSVPDLSLVLSDVIEE